jgi:hypothetical protein
MSALGQQKPATGTSDGPVAGNSEIGIDHTSDTAIADHDDQMHRFDIWYQIEDARRHVCDFGWTSIGTSGFLVVHKLDREKLVPQIGKFTVLPIYEFPNNRFNFEDESGLKRYAFVFEALAEDGETTIDWIALPTDELDHVLTLLDRVGVLGSWNMLGCAAYYMDGKLPLHRTVLGWLQSGCDGSVVVNWAYAVETIRNAPGPIDCRDAAHHAEVSELIHRFSPRIRLGIADPTGDDNADRS